MSIIVDEDILLVNDYIQTDVIIENTSNNGVLIENVLLKDGNISIGSGTSSYTFPSEKGSAGQIMVLNTSGSLVFETSGSSPNAVLAPSVFGTDNQLIKSSGTSRDVEATGITVSDTNDISGVNSLTIGSGTSAYTFPTETGSENQVLTVSSSGSLVFSGSSGNANAVLAPETFGTDNRLVRTLGTDRDVEATGISIDDSNNISGINDLNVSGNTTISGNLEITGTFSSSGNTSFNDLTISGTTESTSNTSGALVVNGGLGVSKDVNIGGDLSVNGSFSLGSGTSSYQIPSEIGTDGQILQVNSEGGLVFTNFTGGNANSVLAPETFGTDNRLVRTLGTDRDVEATGISIDDNNNISGINDLNVSGNTTISGNLELTGDLNLSGTLNNSGTSTFEDISISGTTESTSNTTGALVVNGGAGISKDLNVGGDLNVNGVLSLGSGTSGYQIPSEIGTDGQILQVNSEGGLVFTNFTGGNANSVLAPETFGTDNRLVRTLGTERDVEATGISIDDNNNISGVNDLNISGNTTISGNLELTGDLNLSGTLNNSGTSTFEDISISGTTESTSNTTGALVVNGGAGISKDLNVGGDLSVNGSFSLGSGTSSYQIPSEIGTNGQILQVNSEGGLVFTNFTEGNANSVLAPETFGTDNRLVRTLGTDRDVEATGISIDDNNNISGINDLNVSGNTTISGDLNLSGTLNNSGNSTFDEITVSATTTSTSNTSGALVVNGGVGISENLNVGGNITIDGTTSLQNTNMTNATISSSLTLGSGTSSYQIPTEIGTDGQILQVNSEGGLVFTDFTGGNANSVLAPETFGTDNRLVRTLGTERDVEATGISISDTNDISGINDLNVSGNTTIGGTLNITDATPSISATSGAVVIAGGIGIGGDISVGGDINLTGELNITGNSSLSNLTLTDTTQSNDVTSGALIVQGGAGIAKNVNIGENLTVTGTTNLGSTLEVTGASTINSTLRISSTLDSTSSTSNGALKVDGGVSIAKNLFIGGDLMVEGTTTTVNSTTTSIVDPMFKVATGNPADTYDFGFYGEYVSGGNTIYSGFHRVGADSTPTTPEVAGKWILFDGATTEPGPLNVGDAGVAGDLIVGGLTATSINNSGLLSITDTTQSTATNNGSLIVAGGVGVAKNLNIGGNFDVTGNTTLTNTTISSSLTLGSGTTSYSIPTEVGSNGQVLQVNSSGGLVFTTLTEGNTDAVTTPSPFGTDNRLTKTSGTGREVEATGISIDDSNNVSGINDLNISGNTTISGNLELTGDLNLSGTLNNSGTSTFEDISISGTTESTSNTTGALVVNGGAGIAKDLNIGGDLSVNGSTTLQDTTMTNATISSSLTLGSGTSSYQIPNEIGSDGQILQVTSTGGLIFTDLPATNTDVVTTLSPFGTDNRLVKSSGTDREVEATGISIDDSNNVSGINDLNISGNTTISGNLELTGDLNLSGTLNNSGTSTFEDITISGTTESTSNTTGALVVNGGAGIAKDLNVGGDLSIDGSTSLQNTNMTNTTISSSLTLGSGTSSYQIPVEIGNNGQILQVNSSGGLVFTDFTEGNANSVLAPSSFGTDNRLVKSSGTERDVEATGISIDDGDNITGVNSINVVSSATIGGNLIVSNNTTINQVLTIGSGTSSYNFPTETGSENDILQVNASGDLVFTALTTNPNTVLAPSAFGTDNRLVKTSGTDRDLESTNIVLDDIDNISGINDISVSGNSTFSGTMNILDTTQSTNATTGALIVNGGVGIVKNLNVGGSLEVSGNSTLQDTTITNATISASLTIGSGTSSYAIPIEKGGEGEVLGINGGNLEFVSTSDNVTATNSFGTDNRMVKTVGTNKEIEATNIIIDDNDNITGINDLTVSGNSIFSGTMSISNTLTLGSGTNSYTFPTEKGSENQILSLNTEGGLIFVNLPNSTEVSATITTSTTSTTYTTINSMTTTPAAGTYIVIFSASGNGNSANQQIEYAIHSGGTIVQRSHRFQNYSIQNSMNGMRCAYFTQARVTVNGSQAIDVRYRTNTSTITLYERSLVLIEI